MVNTDMSHILWNLDARRVAEELRAGGVARVAGHGAIADVSPQNDELLVVRGCEVDKGREWRDVVD